MVKAFTRFSESSEFDLGTEYAAKLFQCVAAVFSGGAKDSCIDMLTGIASLLAKKFGKGSPSTYLVREHNCFTSMQSQEVNQLIHMVEKSNVTPPPLVQTSLAQVVCIMSLISSFFSTTNIRMRESMLKERRIRTSTEFKLAEQRRHTFPLH